MISRGTVMLQARARSCGTMMFHTMAIRCYTSGHCDVTCQGTVMILSGTVMLQARTPSCYMPAAKINSMLFTSSSLR